MESAQIELWHRGAPISERDVSLSHYIKRGAKKKWKYKEKRKLKKKDRRRNWLEHVNEYLYRDMFQWHKVPG